MDTIKTARSPKPTRGIFEKVPGSGIWWIRYMGYVDGRKKYKREQVGTFRAAEKLLIIRKNEALEGRKLPKNLRSRKVLFSEIADDALAYSKSKKRSYRDDASRMKRLKEWFGDAEADALDGHTMEVRLSAISTDEKWAASTFNHYRSLLMLCYREARRAKKVSTNPARDIRHLKEDNTHVRYLSRGEKGEYVRLMKVLRAEWPEHVAEVIFALSTGLRLSSQYGATYEMMDWSRNVLDIPRTKNDEPVHVPLNSEVLAAFRTLPSWSERKGPIFRNLRHPNRPVLSNDHWFKPAMKAAGIANFRWHDLRHTFASWLVQDGVPLDRVSKLLGHKSLAMTMRYAHLAPGQLENDVELLARTTRSTTVAPSTNEATAVSVTYIN